MHRPQRSGLVLVLISAAGYSFFAILTKIIYEHGLTQPLDILIWRFVLAAPMIWAVIGASQWERMPDASTRPLPRVTLLGMGVLFGVVATSAFFALSRLPVSLYTVLIYTYPTLVGLGAILFGERLSGPGWMALGLTTVGIILTVPNVFSGFTGVDSLGIVLVLANSVSYAAYILLSNRILHGHQALMQASALSITGSFLFVVGIGVMRGVTMPGNVESWGGLLALATISTVIPAITFYSGMQKLGAPRTAIISTVEPVLTLIWAALLLGERLEPVQVVGAAFIIGSVILLQVRREDRPEIVDSGRTSSVNG